MEYISRSEKETEKIAKKTALGAHDGAIFAFQGDLGSGKTTFAKYFAKALGVDEPVTSPTFNLMKNYKIHKDDSEWTLVHIDAYRFDNKEGADVLDLPSLLNTPKTIFIIEWPEKISNSLEKHRFTLVKFEYVNPTSRKIIL